MNTTPPFPPELWEQTPLAVREYIRTLEARVAELEATVQRLLERLQQDSQNSSRPPSSDPPQALAKRARRGPSGRKRGGQQAIPGRPGRWSPWRRSTLWSRSSPSSVGAVSTHCRARIPSHTGIR